MRTALAGATAAALLATPFAAPASAAPPAALVLTCELHYDTYIGWTDGRGSCQDRLAGFVTMTFRAYIDPLFCPLRETASGTFTGAGFGGSISWDRYGVTSVVRTSDPYAGSGAGVHLVTSPAGNPCGASNVKVMAVLTVVHADDA